MMIRYLLLVFLCAATLVWAENPETVELRSLAENPLTFSPEMPVDLSQDNRKNYQNNPVIFNEEAKTADALIKHKKLPWLPLASLFAVVLTIGYIRLLPDRRSREKIDPITKEKVQAEIKASLQKLSLKVPAENEEAKISIMQLNTLLRTLMLSKYELPAFSYTSQELIAKLDGREEFQKEIKNQIEKIFSKAEKIKFAKDSITPDEFVALVSPLRDNFTKENKLK